MTLYYEWNHLRQAEVDSEQVIKSQNKCSHIFIESFTFYKESKGKHAKNVGREYREKG